MDRVKELIKVKGASGLAGLKVVLTHPAVADAGVVGEPDQALRVMKTPRVCGIDQKRNWRWRDLCGGPRRGLQAHPEPHFAKKSGGKKIGECGTGQGGTQQGFKILVRGGWGIHADDVVCTEDRLELDPSSFINAVRLATNLDENDAIDSRISGICIAASPTYSLNNFCS